MQARQRVRRAALLVGLIIALGGVTWWGWVPQTFNDPRCQLSANASWMGVEWTSQPVNAAAVDTLARDATARNVRSLFFYTAYRHADGTFTNSYTHARDLITRFRQANRTTAVFAWVGLPTLSIRLDDVQTRQQIAGFMAALVARNGFDGLHINAEPVADGDPHYLQLLEETRTALGPTYKLSVAGLPWLASWEESIVANRDYRWSSSYYQAVARRVDQIATMTYDSHTREPALYRLWLREQVRGILGSVSMIGVDVVIGVSVSHEATVSHDPKAENLLNGLAGMCAGVTKLETHESLPSGVAIYAAWDMNATDWQMWERWQAHQHGYNGVRLAGFFVRSRTL